MVISVRLGIRIDLTRDEDAEPIERAELTEILVEELESMIPDIDFDGYTVDTVSVGIVK
jgi:hypothetical protein